MCHLADDTEILVEQQAYNLGFGNISDHGAYHSCLCCAQWGVPKVSAERQVSKVFSKDRGGTTLLSSTRMKGGLDDDISLLKGFSP